MGKILVTGATGTVGSLVLRELERKGESVRGASRDPVSAKKPFENSEFVFFDLERPETFIPALSGTDRVFLIARPGDPEPARVAIPLIDEMKKQGIRHVVDLSAMGVGERNDITLRKVERYIEDSGIAFTHLRPNWFMQVFSSGPMFRDIHTTGALHLPAADAAISYVDARDIASVAAEALTEPGHSGRAYTLTGPRALDHDQVVSLLSASSGKKITYLPISEEEARLSIQAAGLSCERAERLIGFYKLIREGFCNSVSDDIRAVLGRPPISFERFAEEQAACWS